MVRPRLECSLQRAKADAMQRTNALSPILISCLLLAGCASSSKTYPSLAIRDAERVSGTFTVANPAVRTEAAPLSEDVAKRLKQIEARARSNHQAFVAATPGARRAVELGADAAAASNSWGDAQVALSDLDSLRSVTAVALGDLDLLFVDTTLAFEQRDSVAAARDAVIELIRAEDMTLRELRGKMRN